MIRKRLYSLRDGSTFSIEVTRENSRYLAVYKKIKIQHNSLTDILFRSLGPLEWYQTKPE